jgi:hypothetical protein
VVLIGGDAVAYGRQAVVIEIVSWYCENVSQMMDEMCFDDGLCG